MNRKLPLNLYIHIPFCSSKCHYCAFYSIVSNQNTQERYLESIITEIKLLSDKYKNFTLVSIYFGGGTPSLLTHQQINRLLITCKKYFNLQLNCEITLESNPESLTKQKLIGYYQAGINRLSIGLQAWQNELLLTLGRTHTASKFKHVFALARQVGFTNISIDCIFGIPSQTLDNWEETLSNLIVLNPEHISCYSLELDNPSVFGKLLKRGLILPMGDHLDRKMYSLAKIRLKQAGYTHYEISNFAKPNHECAHNLNFWMHGQYLGVGAGAYSYIDHQHYHHSSNIIEYLSDPKRVVKDISNNRQLEWLILRLRLINGFKLIDFKHEFNQKLPQKIIDNINELRTLKLLSLNKNRLKLTSKGQNLYNSIISNI